MTGDDAGVVTRRRSLIALVTFLPKLIACPQVLPGQQKAGRPECSATESRLRLGKVPTRRLL
jgi:hypothetical protein